MVSCEPCGRIQRVKNQNLPANKYREKPESNIDSTIPAFC